MKIVVIGGTGLIGSKTVAILRQGGHEVVAASRKAGVNTVTGEGLEGAMAGAQVVIDVSNAPSFDAQAVMEFFETSGRNLLAAEAAAAFATMSFYPSSEPIGYPAKAITAPKSPKRNWSRLRVSPTRSFVRPSSWNSSALLPMRVLMDTSSDCRPACFSLSRPTTSLPSSTKWPSLVRETGSSRSQARNERRSAKWSDAT